MGTVIRASFRKPVDDKCKDCIYDDKLPGTWRQQVANCTVTTCALWPIRPLPLPRSARPTTSLGGPGDSPETSSSRPEIESKEAA